ncbi:hypothetical protein PF003_g8311 [Phytophthora fragariae]|nr:hypothetical protein PF003_g8311 [Phytophthora fragariae]
MAELALKAGYLVILSNPRALSAAVAKLGSGKWSKCRRCSGAK